LCPERYTWRRFSDVNLRQIDLRTILLLGNSLIALRNRVSAPELKVPASR